jgi:hypothetical protein
MAASIHSLARVLTFPGEHRSALVASGPIRAERRLKYRYPMDLSVRFRSCSGVSPFSGAGLATNLSSGGVLVTSQHQSIEGELVEISIEWPSLLNGKIPLQLIAVGRVLRCGASHFAATFERYEFRTMKSPSQSQARSQ